MAPVTGIRSIRNASLPTNCATCTVRGSHPVAGTFGAQGVAHGSEQCRSTPRSTATGPPCRPGISSSGQGATGALCGATPCGPYIQPRCRSPPAARRSEAVTLSEKGATRMIAGANPLRESDLGLPCHWFPWNAHGQSETLFCKACGFRAAASCLAPNFWAPKSRWGSP